MIDTKSLMEFYSSEDAYQNSEKWKRVNNSSWCLNTMVKRVTLEVGVETWEEKAAPPSFVFTRDDTLCDEYGRWFNPSEIDTVSFSAGGCKSLDKEKSS
jgi:hypothetical protein